MDGIKNNFNNRFAQKNTAFRAENYNNSQSDSVQIPDLYYQPQDSYEPQSFKDTIKQYDMMEVITPWMEHPLIMAGTTGGVIWGIGKFSDAFCGEYEKSLVGRAANLGNRIQNSRIINNDFVHSTANAIRNGGKHIRNFICKNDAVRAMFETPGMPEWAMPKHEMIPSERRLVENFNRVVSGLGLTDGAASKSGFLGLGGGGASGLSLENLGLDKAEKDFLKREYNVKNVFKIQNAEEAINKILIKRFNLDAGHLGKENCSELIKNDIIEKVLKTDKENLARLIKAETKESAEEIYKILDNCEYRKNLRVGGGHYKFLGKAQLFERKIGVEGVYNNLKAVFTNSGLGKCFAKITQGFYNCMTFFGGGKLCALIFIAPMIARAIINSRKAEKGEKVGTLADGIITGASWVLTFPLGMKLMHAIGGMQFSGMSKEDVALFRNKMAAIEAKNKAGGYATKKDYNDAWKELENLRKSKAKDQSIITKMFKKVGSFLEIGNENKKGWIKPDGNKVANWFRRSGNRMKNVVGVPLRFCLFMFGIQTLLDGCISKVANKIFGKHYSEEAKLELDARKKEQETFSKQDLQQRLLEIQAKKQGMNADGSLMINNTDTNMPQQINAQNINSNSNEQKTSQNVNNETKQQTQKAFQAKDYKNNSKLNETKKRDNYTYIPSQENVIKNNADNKEKTNRKYIPSQEGVKINKTFDNSGMNDVLRRADRAEKQALNILAGNFPNM